MAQFEVITTAEEQHKLLIAIANNSGKTISVDALAREANLPTSRARYALQDLITSGQVLRVPTKAYNKNYVRYAYYLKGGGE